jgi:RNA polymerase sigma-70 factor (ECF subfamily)
MNEILISRLLAQRQKLLAFIRKKVADPETAEDILQDSLAKALKSAGEIRDDERFISWFYTILNNAIIDFYRHRAVEARHIESSDYQLDSHAAPDQSEESELCECFRDLLPALKPEYAELIEKLDLADGDPATLASKLGTNINNLKVRRHRARQALRERLEETCRTCAKHGCLDCTCSRN